MKKILLLSVGTAVVVGSILSQPVVSRAQDGAAAKEPQTVKTVLVTLDFVDVPPSVFDKCLTQLLPPHEHGRAGTDFGARLLAALVGNGAKDTKGPQVRMEDDGSGRNDQPVKPASDERLDRLPRASSLVNSLDARAHINPDASITVAYKFKRASLSGHNVSEEDFSSRDLTSYTFVDGETRCVSGPRIHGSQHMEHPVFLTVRTVSNGPGNRVEVGGR